MGVVCGMRNYKMKWNDPVYPPTQEKIIYDGHGNVSEDCPKRLEAQPSMTVEQYAFIQIITAIKSNSARAFVSPENLVDEALRILELMVERTGD